MKTSLNDVNTTAQRQANNTYPPTHDIQDALSSNCQPGSGIHLQETDLITSGLVSAAALVQFTNLGFGDSDPPALRCRPGGELRLCLRRAASPGFSSNQQIVELEDGILRYRKTALSHTTAAGTLASLLTVALKDTSVNAFSTAKADVEAQGI